MERQIFGQHSLLINQSELNLHGDQSITNTNAVACMLVLSAREIVEEKREPVVDLSRHSSRQYESGRCTELNKNRSHSAIQRCVVIVEKVS